MTGKIRKITEDAQHSGRPMPKIIGANEITNTTPEILDKNTKQEGVPVDVRVHTETVREEDKARLPKREFGDPLVRVRSSDRAAWEAIKRMED